MREIIAGIFICMGTIVFALSLLGIYRLKYVMNRMHAAAMGDTMGLGLVVIGLIILCKIYSGDPVFLDVQSHRFSYDWEGGNADE